MHSCISDSFNEYVIDIKTKTVYPQV